MRQKNGIRKEEAHQQCIVQKRTGVQMGLDARVP
jgi:hypothetical protein